MKKFESRTNMSGMEIIPVIQKIKRGKSTLTYRREFKEYVIPTFWQEPFKFPIEGKRVVWKIRVFYKRSDVSYDLGWNFKVYNKWHIKGSKQTY